jgi:hypothetical protein
MNTVGDLITYHFLRQEVLGTEVECAKSFVVTSGWLDHRRCAKISHSFKRKYEGI